MITYKAKVIEMLKQFEKVMVVNILREENMVADALAVETSHARPFLRRIILLEVFTKPFIESPDMLEVNMVIEEDNWMVSYIKYLSDG